MCLLVGTSAAVLWPLKDNHLLLRQEPPALQLPVLSKYYKDNQGNMGKTKCRGHREHLF